MHRSTTVGMKADCARNAAAGSTRDARRAGSQLAVAAMASRIIAELARVNGSVIATPKSSANT